jgi:hypothetical protein
MPTWLWERGYRFGTYPADCDEPPHVHVVGGGGFAKFWLDPVEVVTGRGYNAHRLTDIGRIIVAHRLEFLEKWRDLCSST